MNRSRFRVRVRFWQKLEAFSMNRSRFRVRVRFWQKLEAFHEPVVSVVFRGFPWFSVVFRGFQAVAWSTADSGTSSRPNSLASRFRARSLLWRTCSS